LSLIQGTLVKQGFKPRRSESAPASNESSQEHCELLRL